MSVVRGRENDGVTLPFTLRAPLPAPDPVLEGFHPAVAEWFRRRFADGPTAPQREGWPEIEAGHHTLIAAPTGSGKTLAGFLECIDRLYRAHAEGSDVEGTARVVYVSPLKALAVDIAENLERPLAEIAAVADELGLDAPRLRVAVRTGDTTSSERAAMLRRPPTFVVTTPESLYLLATSAGGRELLRTVGTVIVDEIHAVARDKRGAHLALTLERLEALADTPPQRIGLSATQRPIETVARLLVGNRPLPSIVDAGHLRALDLRLVLPDGELEAVTSAEQMADVLDDIAARVQEHHTTLVFVNTRRLAERLAHQLGERLGPEVVAAHHGSLSKERRHRVETRLRAGDLRALVATASLELGIDIGPVELVCQVGSPRSIATFLQRVGRSNHSRAGTPKGRIYPLTRDELIECTALLAAVRAGRLDAIVPSREPLDILAQHLVAEVAAQEWNSDELYALVTRSAPFAELTRARYDEVVELVSNGIETGRGRRGAYLHHDTVNHELRARKGARLAAVTSGGAIPETGDYRVVAEPDDTFIGTVNEDWAVESMAGDIFLLGTHSWQIRRIELGVVRVRDAGEAPPTVPFWMGEAPARTAELSAEVSALRDRVDALLDAADPDAARAWLREAAGIDDDAATMIVDYLAVARAVLGAMPTCERLVFERFFDETGGMQLVVHSPHGGRVNRALGLALRKRFCRTFNFELQAAATDDAIVLSLGPHHSFVLSEVPRYVHSGDVHDTLEHAILDSPMFQARWRWNLNRSLMVLRFRGGRKNPPPIQRMEADDLMAAVFPQAAACQENVTGPVEIPDHVLVRQTVDDTLHEALDADGLRDLLARVESGEVAVHCVDTTEPSVLAHEILTARPYAFLDDEEFQNRRTNAVQLRRGLSVDLASIGALDPDAIARVHEEIRPEPTTADDLHDVLASLVITRPVPEWSATFDELVLRNRAVHLRTGTDGLWCAAELRDTAERAAAGEEDAIAVVLRGHLEIGGISTADTLAAATTLPPRRVEAGLAVLERDGFALQGRVHAGCEYHGVGGPAPAGPHARLLPAFPPAEASTPRRHKTSCGSCCAGTTSRPAPSWRAKPASPRRSSSYRGSRPPRWRGSPRSSPAGSATTSPRCSTGCATTVRSRGCASRRARATTPTHRSVPRRRPRRSPSSSVPTSSGSSPPPVSRSRSPNRRSARRPRSSKCSGHAARASPTSSRRSPDGCPTTSNAACGTAWREACSPPTASARSGRGSRHHATAASKRAACPACCAALGPRARARDGGRWCHTPHLTSSDTSDRHELAEAVAEQLLNRWGVVFRDLARRDSLRVPWRDVQWALRRLEDRGLVRGGRFVSGFSGEQYALPEAVEQLAHVRKAARTGERVVVNATDPLNLVGLVVPGATVPAVRTRQVVYVDGIPEETLASDTTAVVA